MASMYTFNLLLSWDSISNWHLFLSVAASNSLWKPMPRLTGSTNSPPSQYFIACFVRLVLSLANYPPPFSHYNSTHKWKLPVLLVRSSTAEFLTNCVKLYLNTKSLKYVQPFYVLLICECPTFTTIHNNVDLTMLSNGCTFILSLQIWEFQIVFSFAKEILFVWFIELTRQTKLSTSFKSCNSF